MNQQGNRGRQQGGSQQEAYSQPSRQQGGGHDPSRQPQGDYGGSERGYPSGGSGDWRREQDYRGGYRDDQGMQAWRSRSEQERFGAPGQPRDPYEGYQEKSYGSGRQQHSQWSDYGDQGREYSQYGMRDRDDARYGPYGQDQRRPSGMDRDYRGAGYAGPGGYGGGYGGAEQGYDRGRWGSGQRESEQFDPDYDQWRREQLRALDDDYNQWRQDRFKKFSEEFSSWRSSRGQQQQQSTPGTKSEAGTTPGKTNKDNS